MTTQLRRPDLAEIERAAKRLAGAIAETPLTRSQTLSEITGAEVWLKLENLQYTASFKERGALAKLLSLSLEERERGVIAASAGNHALGVACHAARLGIAATIVMPRFTPNVKVIHTRDFGAEVILHGDDFETASAHAHELCRARGLSLIPPFEDPDVIAGQGTIGLEIVRGVPELDAIVVPVGGGGLISGVAVAARGLRPEVEIFGVQSERYPAAAQTFHGEPTSGGGSSIAEGIAVKAPGALTSSLMREWVRDVLVVSEGKIEEAVLLLLEIEKTLVEGAGAASLAALLVHPERFAGRKVCLVVSGGNIDLPVLSSVIERGLARSRRLARLRVALEDVPGALASLARCLGDAGANIVEVHHQRAFTSLHLKSAEVLLVIQTRGIQHTEEILAALGGAGFEAELDRSFERAARESPG